MSEPSVNGSNGGRGACGRFATGNGGGPGNPHGRRVAALRAALYEAVSDEDLRAVVAKLLELAKGGEPAAIRELLDRLLGKPAQSDVLDRIERLEQLASERVGHEEAAHGHR